MKYFKLTALAFVICMGLHSIDVKADSYRTFLEISIPNSGSYYESEEVSKTIDNFQYYKNKTTNGGFLGTSNVLVKTHSSEYGTTAGIKVSEGEEKTWGNVANQYSSNYRARICSTSIVSGATHWGHWIIDGRLAGTV